MGVTLADSLDQDLVKKSWEEARKKVEGEIPAEVRTQCQAKSKEFETALLKMSPEERHKYEALQDQMQDSKDDKEKAKLQQQLTALSPEASAAQTQMNNLLKPYEKDLARANLYCSLQNVRIDSRLNYARALSQFGSPEDKAKAETLMKEMQQIVNREITDPAVQATEAAALREALKSPF